MQAYQDNNKQNRALQTECCENGITASAENVSAKVNNVPVFSVDVTTGKVSNQKQSGRCWMFAALNTFRHKMLNDFNLKEFELSQNHTFFWDKYEKANYFYENILATANEPLTSRKVAFLLQTPQQDGGAMGHDRFDFSKKYGVVPKTVMPESSNSSNSRGSKQLLKQKTA